ncbi:DNA-binding protein c1d [Irineochytrium annulatum]|nr:DNA-binding protein c1d [Irineochytrium annulatum]
MSSEVKKVFVRFKATGNAPILKQNTFRITASQKFQTVINFLRKELNYKATDPLASEEVELLEKAAAFSTAVDGVEEELNQMMEKAPDLMQPHLGSLERAKHLVSLAYTINSLLFNKLDGRYVFTQQLAKSSSCLDYLRTEGSVKGHPVRRELTRIKKYMDKIESITNPDQRKMKIDQDAAKRFVKHSIKVPPSGPDMEKEAENFLQSLAPEPAAAPEKANGAVKGKKRKDKDEGKSPSVAKKSKRTQN